MNALDKVRKTIENNQLLDRGAEVIIGLSGGPDSMCLFDILDCLKNELGITVHPVHVNHGLRGKDADEDQSYVEAFCRERGYDVKIFSYDCKAYADERGITTEEAGRDLRYDSFGLMAEELENPFKTLVAVAHNMDDQAETVLFRILRGTGLDGLKGMDYIREDERGYCVIRPLLDVSREEILEYLRERGIDPRFDKTNDEPDYTRNKLRLELIPELEREYNPKVKEALVRLAKVASQEQDALEKLAEAEYRNLQLKRMEKFI